MDPKYFFTKNKLNSQKFIGRVLCLKNHGRDLLYFMWLYSCNKCSFNNKILVFSSLDFF